VSTGASNPAHSVSQAAIAPDMTKPTQRPNRITKRPRADGIPLTKRRRRPNHHPTARNHYAATPDSPLR
jgi:hypothetical protein